MEDLGDLSIAVCLGGRHGNRGYNNNLLCKSANICLNLWLFLDPFPANELFHSNSQHPDRRGDLTFWTQTVLALRGRDRLCGGSGARPASGPGSIRAPVADNCAALGNYRRIARAVPAKNCDRSAWVSGGRQAGGRNRCRNAFLLTNRTSTARIRA